MHYNYNTHFAYYTYYPCAWDAQISTTPLNFSWTHPACVKCNVQGNQIIFGGVRLCTDIFVLWYSLWSLLNPAWKLKENSIFFNSVIMNLTLKSIVFYFSNGEEYNYIPYLLFRNTHSRLYTPLVLFVYLSVSSLASTFQYVMLFCDPR